MSTLPDDLSAVEAHWRRQIEAYHEAALLHAAVQLGLPELIGEEAWTTEALALALSLPPAPLRRLLRGLAAIGVLAEQIDGSFALTPAGHALKHGAPSRLAEKVSVVVEQYWRPWAELLRGVEMGEPAFDHVFDASLRNWRRDNPGQGALFDSYQAQETLANAAPLVAAIDVAGARTVADIGGGYGGLLAALLRAHPQRDGILFDQPYVVDAALPFLESQGVAERVHRIGGNVLTEIAVAADLYLLNGVLRQFGDQDCATVLGNLRSAMPKEARLLVIERTLPDRAADDPAAIMLDLHMLVVTGGRLRRQDELQGLLTQAGFARPRSAPVVQGLTLSTVIPA